SVGSAITRIARGSRTIASASNTDSSSTAIVSPRAVLHRPRPLSTAASISAVETGDVREQREIPRTLYRGAYLPLMTRAHPADPARQDLSTLRNEARKTPLVLVIDVTDPRLADRARLTMPRHSMPPR